MGEENDLFYHALNYRGAQSQHAELFWQELQACVRRLIEDEREACAKVCDAAAQTYYSGNFHEASGACLSLGSQIRERSNVI